MKIFTARPWRAAIGPSVGLAILAAFAHLYGRFGYTSVCDRCGALRETTQWQVPFTDITLFERSTESDSALSRVLLSRGIVPSHSHHWLFANGGGNGVLCAIGSGRHLRFTLQSEKVAALVRMLHERGQLSVRDRILRDVFNPDLSRVFPALCSDAPATDATGTEIQNWVTEMTNNLEIVESATKRR